MERTTERGGGESVAGGIEPPKLKHNRRRAHTTPPPTIRQRIKETMTPKKIFRLLSSQSIQKNIALQGGVSVECIIGLLIVHYQEISIQLTKYSL